MEHNSQLCTGENVCNLEVGLRNMVTCKWHWATHFFALHVGFSRLCTKEVFEWLGSGSKLWACVFDHLAQPAWPCDSEETSQAGVRCSSKQLKWLRKVVEKWWHHCGIPKSHNTQSFWINPWNTLQTTREVRQFELSARMMWRFLVLLPSLAVAKAKESGWLCYDVLLWFFCVKFCQAFSNETCCPGLVFQVPGALLRVWVLAKGWCWEIDGNCTMLQLLFHFSKLQDACNSCVCGASGRKALSNLQGWIQINLENLASNLWWLGETWSRNHKSLTTLARCRRSRPGLPAQTEFVPRLRAPKAQ